MIHLLALDLDGSIVDLIERESRDELECSVHTASYHYELVVKCQENRYDAVLIDLDHPRSGSLEEIDQLKTLQPSIRCYVLTSLPQWEQALQAMKSGADDYLAKPVHPDKIRAILQNLNKRPVHRLTGDLKLEFNKSKRIIGRSTAIKKVYDLIQKLARVDTSVLIRGESGTGKELVAQALHYNSSRKQGPFVAVNCGAIPETLIESELFGYEKGTFTGADKKKLGKFQFANGGSIFLDEIGDVSPQMQVKLLRVLQEKKITPVGSNQEIPVDVRIISATNKPLEKMMQEGKFRSDLYYRLNVMPINLQPLRERLEDIEDLSAFMIEKFNRLHERQIRCLTPEVVQALQGYDWPGNIRELENVIEHAFIIEGTDEIHLDSLPPHIQNQAPEIDEPHHEVGETSRFQEELRTIEQLMTEANSLKYPELKEQFEKEFIKRALKAFNGRINQTAEQTQMTKVTLLRKLEKYNINPKEYQH
ncbi:sigma-54 dependent transcriptional regulator [Oligoflexus tunisiensis]|uniref:sigma-54 dependent transcriptional regulator n=1 Tax=Oligoflexus tunisiensis TaxID=708132 RepID=UPI00159F1D18|nr:sigma-54 dependent transcriptional regulator [Oligoflexus tunisiensis]